MKKKTYIYALVDPFTSIVRYVGKSNNPNARLRRHIKDGKDNTKSDHKTNWIAKIIRLGKIPELRILEICDYNNWKIRERYWIKKLRDSGCDLTNSKDGGEGLNLSQESRDKMSKARIGKVPHNKGKKTSVDIRKKQSEAAKKRWENMSDEDRNNILKNLSNDGSRPGWNHTREAKEKISKSLIGNKRTKGYKQTNETKMKRAESLKGHTVTRETREKIARKNRSLSMDQAREIRNLILNGKRQSDIAKIYGVSKTTINQIKSNKSYIEYD